MNLIERSYSDLPVHKMITGVIRRHSENKGDIREKAHNLLDWGSIHTMVDLGCGYGWFEQDIGHPLDFILGIDYLEENRDEFLMTVKRIARKSEFRALRLPTPLDLPSGHFDLVVSAYSLYFFPASIGEIARILSAEGTFLIITHSEAMLEEGERFFHFENLKKVIRGFSAENGEALLTPHFSRVTSIDFSNSLVFDREDGQDLSLYIDFKGAFISKDVIPERAKEAMLGALEREGRLRFNKNDRIFVVKK